VHAWAEASRGQALNLTDWTEKRPGFANRTQAPHGFGHKYARSRCMSTREAFRCQASQGTDPRARTANRGTAFKILLGSGPCNACDKMGLGRTRFPHGSRTHESHDNDSAKAATGRPDAAAAERARILKPHGYRFPRRCSRSLRRRPRHIQEVVRCLAGELRHGLCADPAS